MVYPERLLPLRHFGYILPKSIFNGYLIRYTKSEVPDDLDNQLRSKYVCEPREQILNLSCNLLGHYKVEDIKIEIKKDFKLKYFNKWFPFSSSLKPAIDEFSIIEDRGYYVIPVSEAHSHQVPVKAKNADFTLKCFVVHCPTKCNYWHFELRWQDEDGNFVTRDDRKYKRVASTSARAMVAELMRSDIDDHKEVKAYKCSLFLSWTGLDFY